MFRKVNGMDKKGGGVRGGETPINDVQNKR